MSRKSTTRPDLRQTLLNWDPAGREERKAAVRAIAWQRTGLTRKQWANAVDVLCALIGHDRDGMFPSVPTLCEWCSMSERTVKRTTKNLRCLGILSTRRRGSTSNFYTIDSRKLFAIGVVDGPEVAQQMGQNGPTEGPNWPIGEAKLALRHNKELTLTEHEPTTSSTACANEVEEVEVFKRKVREAFPNLLRCDRAIDAAIANGCTIKQLRDRVRWFRDHQFHWKYGGQDYRMGALHDGLASVLPGIAADKGWPHQ